MKIDGDSTDRTLSFRPPFQPPSWQGVAVSLSVCSQAVIGTSPLISVPVIGIGRVYLVACASAEPSFFPLVGSATCEGLQISADAALVARRRNLRRERASGIAFG